MTPETLPRRTRGRPHDTLLSDVAYGLQPDVRMLPPKYFYDDVGAELFDRITTLEEYYPTRVEIEVLRRDLPDMARAIGPGVRVVEFGSGSGLKTRLLLSALDAPSTYIPVDVSAAQLQRVAAELRREFPAIPVQPLCADYMQPLRLPAVRPGTRTVAFFPGSTIGNLVAEQAAAFLRRTASECDAMLLGTDMHKPTPILERAYNDEAGVTAAFNLNLLTRIERELGAELRVDDWRHHAFYDEAAQRIEMRLVADADTTIVVPAGSETLRYEFAAGEWITTEYSQKYTSAGVRRLAVETGWRVDGEWSDDAGWFTVWLLTSTDRRSG
jgi:L-histidine Nalpha-methyltransferase